MIPKIAKTEDLGLLIKEINERLRLIEREFATKDEAMRVKLSSVKSLSNRSPRDMEETELRYRDKSGTMQLILRKGNKLYSEDLTEETI